MPTTYSGDDTNNPTDITLPSDGDASTVSSVNPAFEGLMDKICYVLAGIGVTFEGRKLFADFVEFEFGIQIGALGDEAEYDAAIAIHDDISGDRKLLLQFKLDTTYWGRLYAREGNVNQSPGIEFTVNAAWNGTDWEPDLVTGSSKVIEFFGGNNGFIDNDDTMVIIRRKGYAARTPTASQLTFAAAGDTITRVAGDWTTEGFHKGQTIRIAGTASNDGTHEVTAVSTSVLTVGNTLVNETITSAGITICTYPWTALQWDKGAIGFATGNPASGDTIPRNMMFAKGMPVAWGVVSTNGSGAVTVADSYNINAAATAIVGTDVRITLARSMASVNYGVSVTSKNKGSPLACHEIVGALEFDIRWANNAHAGYDAAAVALGASFVVWGEVSDNVT